MIIPGLVSITFRQFSPEKIVDLATQAGLQSIEWGGDIHVPPGKATVAQDVLRLTQDEGLQVAAYGSYYRAGECGSPSSFDPVLETAIALKAPTIRVWCGNRSSAQADEAYRLKVAGDLHHIAGKASRYEISISSEYHQGTLTDGLESALEILRSANHSNLKSYWQPRHGAPVTAGLNELSQLASFLTNLHVYHWQYNDSRELIRLPLSEGLEQWRAYLTQAGNISGERHALLEFASHDEPGQFLRDARSFKSLLAETADLGHAGI